MWSIWRKSSRLRLGPPAPPHTGAQWRPQNPDGLAGVRQTMSSYEVVNTLSHHTRRLPFGTAALFRVSFKVIRYSIRCHAPNVNTRFVSTFWFMRRSPTDWMITETLADDTACVTPSGL